VSDEELKLIVNKVLLGEKPFSYTRDAILDLHAARERIAELEAAVKKLATGMAEMAMDVSELETREARWKTLVKYVAEGTWQCKSASVKPKWWDKQLMERCDRFLEAMLEGEDA